MPKTPLHTLTWSQDHAHYELSTQGQRERIFSAEDTNAWLNWLTTATSFTFRGAAGRLNVYCEARRETAHYWYAYQTTGKRTRKRYLGLLARVTFTRLEEIAAALGQDAVSQDTAEPSAMAGMPLLSTSLVPLRLRADLVVRKHLLIRLDAARSHRLTLLAASAGWGKTTLLSMWAARLPFPVAWLSLSALENDPARFWVAVIAALRHSGASSLLVGERSLTLLRSPQPPELSTILGMLIQDLSGQDTPIFLMLDDYQVIEEQVIHDSLLFLLEHLPPHLHLVLASRIDPPLALARWRAHGALLELRDTDLHFQEDEASQFLTQTMKLELDPTEILVLTQRTEGWIAGLHLAALALAHSQDHASFIHGFAGNHRYLADYVQEDILAHVEQPLHDFLLHCAILTSMSATLCQAVTAQADMQTSQQMLEQLERANLFLVPLDEERRWYRLHDLFREALLARLHATRPELVRPLHLQAAGWYEREGERSEAIAHRLAAADYTGAAQVMEEAAEQFWLSGEAVALFRWIMVLPDEVVRARAGFVLKATLYLLNSCAHTTKAQFRPVHAQAERLLLRVEEAMRETEENGSDPFSHHRHLLRQRIQLVRLTGDVFEAEAIHDLEQMTRLIQQGMQESQDDDLFWLMIPLGSAFLYHYTLRGEGALVVPRLLEMKRRVSRAGDHFALLRIKQWLALASRQTGQLRQVHQESLEGLALLEHIQGHTYLAGYFSLCLAYVYFEWNRLDEARTILHKMIRDATAWQQIDRLMWGYMVLVELEIAAGNLQTAHEILQEESFKQLEEQGIYRFWRTSAQVHLWLAEGKMAEAASWAAQTTFRPADWTSQQTEGILTLVHVYLAGQQYSQALEILETFRASLDRPENIETTISFLSISATALHLVGKQGRARTTVLRLLHLTRQEGHLRVYLDMGEPMQHLLQSLLDEPQEEASPLPGSYLSMLLAAFEQDIQKRAVQSNALLSNSSQKNQASRLTNLSDSVSGQSGPLKTLTQQELRVLRLLADGRSNQDIAHELVVSLNTVKTHVKNLYSKLQVNSRTQALSLARDLQLL